MFAVFLMFETEVFNVFTFQYQVAVNSPNKCSAMRFHKDFIRHGVNKELENKFWMSYIVLINVIYNKLHFPTYTHTV